jgi:hypothetical protein
MRARRTKEPSRVAALDREDRLARRDGAEGGSGVGLARLGEG